MTNVFDIIRTLDLNLTLGPAQIRAFWSWDRSNLIFQMQISRIREHRQLGYLAINQQTNLKKTTVGLK